MSIPYLAIHLYHASYPTARQVWCHHNLSSEILLHSWHQISWIQKSGSMELHEWIKTVVNVENCPFLKGNCKFFSVIWVKWKQSVSSITLAYSSTFYSLFLSLFVLETFKFKYHKLFVRYSASITAVQINQIWKCQQNFWWKMCHSWI